MVPVINDVITLVNNCGEDVDFIILAIFRHSKGYYTILQPLLLEHLGEEEALVFDVRKIDEETEDFILITDEKLIAKIFDKYNKLFVK